MEGGCVFAWWRLTEGALETVCGAGTEACCAGEPSRLMRLTLVTAACSDVRCDDRPCAGLWSVTSSRILPMPCEDCLAGNTPCRWGGNAKTKGQVMFRALPSSVCPTYEDYHKSGRAKCPVTRFRRLRAERGRDVRSRDAPAKRSEKISPLPMGRGTSRDRPLSRPPGG